VTHPRTYSEDDPFLADIRRLALALPETVEIEAWGRPTFRAGKKMFAVFTHHEGHGHSLTFKPDADERPALLADARIYSPPYMGPSGWLALDLAAAPVEWAEIAELLETSYRQVALKRMIARL
jgi:predicted DNA-binding protein (MmcQ/YjbR family)